MFVVYYGNHQILRRKDKEPINLCSKEVKVLESWHEQNPKGWDGGRKYQVEKAESVVASAKREENENRELVETCGKV